MKMDIREIGKRFKAVADNPNSTLFETELSGFNYPVLPVITNENSHLLSLEHSWGLIPGWCKDESIRKNTLNARLETLAEKPAFKNYVGNRCLVLATGYFEWRWNDEKGKSKQKYAIHHASADAFAFAGLYSSWNEPTGRIRKTFTIVTTGANEQMRYIHNTKQRMPLMLNPGDEEAWLDAKNEVSAFAYPDYDAQLVAFPV